MRELCEQTGGCDVGTKINVWDVAWKGNKEN